MSHTAPIRLPRLAVSIAAGLLLLSCSKTDQPPAEPQRDQTPPTTNTAPPPETVPTGPPNIEFTSMRYDFGSISDAGPDTAPFEFRNAGGGTLIISDVTASCGCTVPKLDKREYGPGESGTLNVVFDPSNRKGGFIKYVFVTSNSFRSNYAKLAITADITPLLRFDSIFMRLGAMELGQQHERSITGYYQDPDLKITSVTCDNPLVMCRVLGMSRSPTQVDGRSEYQALIGVTVDKAAPWGVLNPGTLTLTALGALHRGDEPRQAVYTLYLSAELYGDLHPVPAMLAPEESVKLGDEIDASLVLSSISGTYFSVIDATLDVPAKNGLEIHVEPIDPSSYRISMHGIAESRGAFNGTVTVRTDVPGEEKLRIEYGGYVK